VTVDHNHAKQLANPEHGLREHGSVGIHAGTAVVVFWVVLNIEIVHRAALEGGASSIAVGSRRRAADRMWSGR
jgi:hypothetical protein